MSETGPVNPLRRAALGKAAAVGLMALAPGVRLVELVTAKPDNEAVSENTRWGMLIDATQCAEGCDDCVTACNDEHGLAGSDRPRTDAQWIRKLTLRDKATEKVTTLPMLCQHCEDPPCVDVCPTGASFRRADGIVLVNKHTCIGCRYCMMACPYMARSFIHENLTDQLPHAPRGKGTVESCTFCVHRVDEGRTPACVEACSDTGGKAMMFGDLNDPDSEIVQRARQQPGRQIRPDLNLNAAVRYEGV